MPSEKHDTVQAEVLTKETLFALLDRPPRASRVFTVTPEIAEVIVTELNKENRGKKPSKIAEYAAEMKRGAWYLTGEALKFSNRGLLRDGQNRLSACMSAGVPFTTHVVFGIADRSFMKMDTGKTRTPGDCLHIIGVRNAALVSSAVRWCLLLDSGRVKQRTTYSNEDILAAWESKYSSPCDGVLLDDSKVWGERCKSENLIAASLGMALHFTFARKNKPLANGFFEGFAQGLNISRSSDPRGRIRKKLQEIRMDRSSRPTDMALAAWIILAWNAYAADRAITAKALEWGSNEPFPLIHSPTPYMLRRIAK